MTSARDITERLIEEGINARAHFQVWWALRNLALPTYHETMSQFKYVDFFHAANSGHYVLFLLALTKIFDNDSRVAGISELKRALVSEGLGGVAQALEDRLRPFTPRVQKLMAIRNRSVVHNEHAIPRHRVYQINGITPNELRELIDITCEGINGVARALSINNVIFDSNRAQDATMHMLETLERGRKAHVA
jgi:HEPN superfamily AbiU2-like protein